MLVKQREHLTVEGLQKIINIIAAMNKGLTSTLKEAFPNSVAVPRPLINNPPIHLHHAPYTQDNYGLIA